MHLAICTQHYVHLALCIQHYMPLVPTYVPKFFSISLFLNTPQPTISRPNYSNALAILLLLDRSPDYIRMLQTENLRASRRQLVSRVRRRSRGNYFTMSRWNSYFAQWIKRRVDIQAKQLAQGMSKDTGLNAHSESFRSCETKL